MRRRIQQLLVSERGASLSIALFLFLVCTMVSSVVLVSGTAAAGRFADLTKMDARYYSVQSAAELLCESFPADASADATVVRQRVNGANPSLVSGPSSGSNLVNVLTNYLVFGADSAQDAWENAIAPVNPFTLALDVTDHSELAADISVSLTRDGASGASAVLDVSNRVADGSNDPKYHLYVTLYGELSESVVPSESISYDADGKEVVTVTETKTSKVHWRVVEVSEHPRGGAAV